MPLPPPPPALSSLVGARGAPRALAPSSLTTAPPPPPPTLAPSSLAAAPPPPPALAPNSSAAAPSPALVNLFAAQGAPVAIPPAAPESESAIAQYSYEVSQREFSALKTEMDEDVVRDAAAAFAMLGRGRERLSADAVLEFYQGLGTPLTEADMAAAFAELDIAEGGALDFVSFARRLNAMRRTPADLAEASEAAFDIVGRACRPRSSDPVEELGVADLQALMRKVGESVTTEEAQDMARYMMSLQGDVPPPRTMLPPDLSRADSSRSTFDDGRSSSMRSITDGPDWSSPKLKKYAMMMKLHLPEGAIRQKMAADGLTDAEIDAAFG